jgi:hypothetical protein
MSTFDCSITCLYCAYNSCRISALLIESNNGTRDIGRLSNDDDEEE